MRLRFAKNDRRVAMPRHQSVAILLVLVAMLSAASFAQTSRVRGRVHVTDGDTLRMGALRIRMHGVDAPEKAQICFRAGLPWSCGQASKAALIAHIGAAPVDCVLKDRDRYQRLIAECFIGKKSVNRWVVAQGWAVAYRQYSTDYVGEEFKAQRARRGIWASRFQLPSDWRMIHRKRH